MYKICCVKKTRSSKEFFCDTGIRSDISKMCVLKLIVAKDANTACMICRCAYLTVALAGMVSRQALKRMSRHWWTNFSFLF
jgi:hypothetical protein